MPTLLSVNLGRPEKIGARIALSGINKHGVTEARIERLGLVGDAVLDRRHHGGPDQAVYIYLQSDYDWWAGELGMPLLPGSFGENLTITGLAGDNLSVGDQLRIGEVLLELTSHRTPCSTFAARMDDPKWVRRFHAARRPGTYARVLAEGVVRPGMAVSYTRFAGETVTLRELVDTDGARTIDPEFMRRALKAPVHYKVREDFETRLATLDFVQETR